MFITEEESDNILKNPRNLANRFKNGKEITGSLRSPGMEDNYAKIIESRISERPPKTEIREISSPESQTENGEKLYEGGIQFREIKRPGNNRPWLPKSVRTRIAADVATASVYRDKTRTEIAKEYGVQISTVSDIANGTRRVEDSPRSVEQEKVDLALDAVREKAIDKLMAGLGHLSDEKVSAHNGKDISVICANMARVVQQTIPQEKAAQQINLVVYTPELRAEKNFDVVEI